MAQVVLDGVQKVYEGQVRVVEDFSLHIADGEFVVLVGASGCGKSTTLRMVAGLEEITAGTITIGDRVVNAVAPKDRNIAMVFQSYALYPHMTVYKNMAFALKLRKMAKPEIDRRVTQAAQKLGIEHLLDRKPKALSGGQRQRVALGRAIVREPACFLFDEPLSNLDAKLRTTTRAELKRLHQDLKTTSIYVTHDQEEALTLGDRIVVMSEGRIQQADRPLEVYRNPANRFVAGFIGMPPMNFIEGRLESAALGLRFEGGGFAFEIPSAYAVGLESAAGDAVVLGVRPEGLYLRPDEHAPESTATQAVASVVEPLGAQMDVFAATSEGQRLVLRCTAEPVSVGEPLALYVDLDKAHFFEPGSHGRNLRLANTATA
ncbi:MAG: sn-glycerol-3-phosphate ABC transporter ATP-binding protein UgpC [Planctomycetota bacterium]